LKNINSFLLGQSISSFSSFTYTFQCRQGMEERIAFVVDSQQDLVEKITNFLTGNTVAGCYHANTKQEAKRKQLIRGDEDNDKVQKSNRHTWQFEKIAQHWVVGIPIEDWSVLY